MEIKSLFSKDRPAQFILTDVLSAGLQGFSNPFFFEHFYASNEYIDQRVNEFLDSLDNNHCIFQLLHGYSKNGKSTFIQYIRNSNNQKEFDERAYRYIINTFDFEKGGASDFIVKVQNIFSDHFIITSIDTELKVITNIHHFIQFYRQFIDSLYSQSNKNNEPISVVQTYFYNFCRDLFDRLEEIVNITSVGSDGNFKNASKLIRNNIIDKIGSDNCGDHFSFLILYEIYLNRFNLLKKDGKPQKIVFVLDNIDDYLVNNDVLFFQHPQIQLSTFINNFTKHSFISLLFTECLRQEIDDKELFSRNIFLSDQIRIVYVFRTANFLVFSNIFQNKRMQVSESAERNFPECLLDRKFVKFKTIRNTNEILRKRLDLFEKRATEGGITFPRGFIFLKYLTDNFSSTEVDDRRKDIDNIFRLWNGDKQAICSHIFDYWDQIGNEFFVYEDIVYKIANTNFYANKYLLKGVYIYFILTLLNHNPKQNGFIDTIFHYKMSYEKSKKNIQRFILNFIINKTEDNGLPETISDVSKKGVGLYDLLNEISKLINELNNNAGEELFSRVEVEKFFRDVYSNKIDYFSHFFTIYKSQIAKNENNQEITTNYYNLDNEINNFYSGNTEGLEDIRIYNNDNAAYFSLYLITNFELFSFCESHDDHPELKIKKPLLFALNKTKNGSSSIENYEFYDIIEKTFNASKLSVTGMVDFYKKHLIKKYPPQKFVENQMFSVRTDKIGDFQFRLLISRHITYLESFRQAIILDKIKRIPIEDKIAANLYLANKILEYITLYKDMYNDISDYLGRKIECTSLNDTFNANLVCENLAKKIMESGGLNFDIVIKSN